MTEQTVLISGAGVAGPTLAYWLARAGYRPTVVEREAAEQHKDPIDHLAHLIVHGCLHAQGYVHENDNQAELMERREIEILKRFKISNPYELSDKK